MQRYVQGFLPNSFSGLWITNQDRRAGGQIITNETIIGILRNSENLYIPQSRLANSSKQPYFYLPLLWSNFTQHEIKIIREKSQFNLALKKYLISLLF